MNEGPLLLLVLGICVLVVAGIVTAFMAITERWFNRCKTCDDYVRQAQRRFRKGDA